MEWVKALRGTIVALDAAPLIYFIEENPHYLPAVRLFFEAVDRGDFEVLTSTLTLTEVLVHPLRGGNQRLADQYRNILLRARHVKTVAITDAIAEAAAGLRSTIGLRTPDAIQCATAIHTGATSFLTNDARLSDIPKLKVLILDQLTTAR